MRRQRHRMLVGGVVILGGLGALIVYSFNQNLVYDHSVSEFLSSPQLQRLNCRIYGKVAEGSVVREPDGIGITFAVTDGTQQIPVSYAREVPDTFKENGDVVVEGVLDAGGTFRAHNLLAKCPSKYEGEGIGEMGGTGESGAEQEGPPHDAGAPHGTGT